MFAKIRKIARYTPQLFIATFILAASLKGNAQMPGGLQRFQGMGGGSFSGSKGGGNNASSKADSLQHRTGLEDSITIRFRFLDSTRMQNFDSSILDFSQRIHVPWHFNHLGNLGTAAENRIFTPIMKSGWDNGLHVLDIYNYTLDKTRFYNTTRPYTEMNYLLGSLSEQYIQITHTQNIKPNWNAAFQYRLINSPGTFQHQNSNHNNYRLTSWYQSKNKRYQQFIIIIGNKLMVGESGGLKSDGNYIDSSVYRDNRYNIPSQLGGIGLASRNFFSTKIGTGSFNTNAVFLLRQQYDLGQKDSIVVNDTTVIPLFYPRLRFEHTISYNTYHNRFRDDLSDSAFYKTNYNLQLAKAGDSVLLRDQWKELVNDFSVYQFPDAKNALQFIKLGVSYQHLSGLFQNESIQKVFNVLYAHGEYRNKTKNKLWDMEAYGDFHIHGYYAGDYQARVRLLRVISPSFGSLQVGFENVNRKPSYSFNENSSFYLHPSVVTLNKENTTHFYGIIHRASKRLKLEGHYWMLGNFTYLTDRFKVAQASSLFSVLRGQLEKDFLLGKKGFHWRTAIILQQRIGAAEVQLPLILTRNQLAYDGNLGYRNLNISTGLEFKYFTSYKANGYSPVAGQFYVQNDQMVSLRRPEIGAFVHFRIKSFTSYVRVENLNTLDFGSGTFSYNNMPLPGYASPGMQIRVGVFWSFVN